MSSQSNFQSFIESIADIIYLDEQLARELSSTVIITKLLPSVSKSSTLESRETSKPEPELYLGYSLTSKNVSAIPIVNLNMLLQLVSVLSPVELVMNACYLLKVHQTSIAKMFLQTNKKIQELLKENENFKGAFRKLTESGLFFPEHFTFPDLTTDVLVSETIVLISGKLAAKKASVDIDRFRRESTDETQIPVRLKSVGLLIKPYVYVYINAHGVQKLIQIHAELASGNLKSVPEDLPVYVLGKVINDAPYDVPIALIETEDGERVHKKRKVTRSIRAAAILLKPIGKKP